MVSVQLAAAVLAVAGGGETVLLDFSASWCGPCRQLAPVIDKLASEGYPVRKIDIDQQPDLAAQYGVTKVPTLILLKNGQPVSRGLGVLSFAQLEGMMQQHGISPAGSEKATVRGQSPEGRGGLFGFGLFGSGNSESSRPKRSTPSHAKSSPEVEAQKEANGPAPRWNPSAQVPRRGQVASAPAKPAGQPPAGPTRLAEASHADKSAPLQPLRQTQPSRNDQDHPSPVRPQAKTAAASHLREESESGWQRRVKVASEPAGSRRTARQKQLEKKLLEASVRISIEEKDGHSYGSGTFIDQRSGEALILTCGHIFRESHGKTPISVDIYQDDSRRELPGRLVYYDLDRDVGLVSVRIDSPVVTARLAPPDHKVRTGETVLSIGCDGGRPPSARWSRVIAVDSIVGPPNLQVKGQPEVGRSGGALFDNDGQVVGVCNFADPTDRAGLFAALAAVHDTMNAAGLSSIYREPDSADPTAPTRLAAQSAAPLISLPPKMPAAMPKDAGHSLGANVPGQALHRGKSERSEDRPVELICIVRPVDKQGSRGELIVINNASSELLSMLSTERRRSHGQFETSFDARAGGSEHARPATEIDATGWQSSGR